MSKGIFILFHLKFIQKSEMKILNFGAIALDPDLILSYFFVKIIFQDQVETNLRNCAKIQITLGKV